MISAIEYSKETATDQVPGELQLSYCLNEPSLTESMVRLALLQQPNTRIMQALVYQVVQN